jgi:hypothetical protein
MGAVATWTLEASRAFLEIPTAKRGPLLDLVGTKMIEIPKTCCWSRVMSKDLMISEGWWKEGNTRHEALTHLVHIAQWSLSSSTIAWHLGQYTTSLICMQGDQEGGREGGTGSTWGHPDSTHLTLAFGRLLVRTNQIFLSPH